MITFIFIVGVTFYSDGILYLTGLHQIYYNFIKLLSILLMGKSFEDVEPTCSLLVAN